MIESIDRMIDFFYGYLKFKSYIFKLKFSNNYYNSEYAKRWREYISKTNFTKVLNEAMKLMRNEIDGKILDIADVMEKSSYYALIHPNHPDITLGFIKDADLWNLWLEYGIYRYVREAIANIVDVGKGDKIIDFGCGSVSPCFYSELIGSSGFYAGIDYSGPLIKIAEKLCKAKGVADRIKLTQKYVESRISFKREYNIAIMSGILEYSKVTSVLKNAINALKGNGVIVIFSEVFTDIEPEREEVFNLYYTLIPNFKKFPSLTEIRNTVEVAGYPFNIKMLGKHIVIINLQG